MSKPTVLQTLKAVAWAFLGIRKHQAYQQDMARINPLHVIVVGIVGVLLLVAGLMSLAFWVVR
jgi:hypothetical protein